MAGKEIALRTVVFLGSARDLAPAWSSDKRLCNRVAAWVKKTLTERNATCGPDKVKHDVTFYDPLEVFGPDGCLHKSGGELKHPHFFYKGGEAPPAMDAMRDTIKACDAIIVVSPEYNHTVPPALSSLMGHFGGSNYSCKPSGIVTYSVGPFGGTRAAIALRPMLSELGCLPVSKLCCLPTASSVLGEDGTPPDASNRLLNQLPDMLSQIEWMAIAMKNQREHAGAF
uniref:NADPH-dependent FMN reductase-like domain-containing protein n=1 Tax=Hemiselmis andersenii TaxID=464988 RepID=A0A6T8I3V3_HEMAN|mmetsp:Transcript_25834/g.59945  ORF Transcript_25834/g.59945 Transcript_25834/m.59945 type:complete len:227 (-) Transcript_25834:315-995(-)|eukprot:CAMPEP_0169453102 /NCGR_PEP_ID=MMETSP1042-20121227/14587_1 /TAXON_ID=464988 /ORGANISM="Hemiselmis andersenii, Strain CCMP1180" /LENGTH=226 /DNA_ID=CAMNT_0009565129 /DNA_START=51 /DNA_END=731 /DNA_ORIENTATION=+